MSGDSGAARSLSPLLGNAPGRLWAFLVSVRTRGADDAPASSAVVDYLALQPDQPVLAAALAAVPCMPRQARAALTGTETPSMLPRASVEVALTEAEAATAVVARPGSALHEARERFGSATLATLKGASAWLIGSSGSAPGGTGRALEELRARAQEVAAAASDAPDGVADGLRARAAGLLDAVRIFPLTGPAGIADAGGAIERLMLRPEVRAAADGSPRLDRAVRGLAGSLRVFSQQSAA